MFSELDNIIQHMNQFGINLGDHKNVKNRSRVIYSMVKSKRMPPSSAGGDGPWDDKKIRICMNAGVLAISILAENHQSLVMLEFYQVPTCSLTDHPRCILTDS